MNAAFLRSFYNFAYGCVTDPEDTPEEGEGKMIIAGAFLAGLAITPMFIVLFVYFRETLAVWVGAGMAIWQSVIVFLFPKWHKNVRWWAHAAGASLLIMLLALTLALGGFAGSGYILPLLGLSDPLVALINLKPREAGFWLGLYVASNWIVFVLQPYLPPSHVPLPASNLLFMVLISFSAVFYFGIFLYFINQRNEAFRLLRMEREKSERLLLNILPQEVAQILKNEPRVIADHFPNASILFADVVSFTPMSATMTPTGLVELLNDVFSHFDMLVEKYGMEKIKTIGDCYMAAAGVPRPRADHAQMITQLAIEIREYVSGHEFQGRKLSFRIGINSGPVTAGVIGNKKFAYDLWGDAVNTASRMESHGTGGAIQITEATYDLIKDEFVCEPQGVVNVKGKGPMNVWYVMGRNESRSAD